MEQIKSKEELNTILNSCDKEQLTVLKFSGTWCGPCKMMSRHIEDIEEDPNNNVKFIECDIDEANPDIIDEYSVMSIPLMIYFKGAFQVGQSLGGMSMTQFKDKLAEMQGK